MENIDKKLRISNVSKRYRNKIDDIYMKYHKNYYRDPDGHMKGIVKAMMDFAIWYHDDKSK